MNIVQLESNINKMGLGSENAVILTENFETGVMTVEERFGQKSHLFPVEVGRVSYEEIKPRKKTEGSSVIPKFIAAILECKAMGELIYQDSRGVWHDGWKNWMSLFAKNNSEQLNLYMELLDDIGLMKSLCEISPDPLLLHLQGKLEVGAAAATNVPWTPEYSATFDGCLNFTDALMGKTDQRKPIPQLLKTSVPIPIHMLKPWGTRAAKITLDVAIDSSNVSFPLEIGVCSASEITKGLFEDDATKDVTFVAGNGAEIKCHSIVVKVHIPAFVTMLDGMREAQTGRIEMKDMSEEAMTHLVDYFYCKIIPLSVLTCDVALQMLQFAEKYKLLRLEDAFTGLFLQKSADWFTPDIILELYQYVKKLETLPKLQEHALRIIAKLMSKIMIDIGNQIRFNYRMPEEVKFCEYFREMDPVEAANLPWEFAKLL